LAGSYLNLGSLSANLKKYEDSRKYLTESVKVSKAIGAKDLLMDAYNSLSLLDSTLGNWNGAYQNYKLFTQVKDSIFNETSTGMIAELETKYESDKKEKEIQLLNKDKILSQTENKKQEIIIYSVGGGLVLMIILAGGIFTALQNNRKKNQIIFIQKEKIQEKQKEITDSITYAKRIQKSILPYESNILSSLPQSFVLYKPKDIVSGDFYWFRKIDNIVLIAAADCTGHGVPGAFTSLICSEKLNEAVKSNTDPGEILSQVNKEVRFTLRQDESADSSRDGMDIAICSINLESGVVRYAGANRPLWILRKDHKEIEEITATKKAIGGFTEDDQIFKTHEIQLNLDDSIYLCSDGFADQLGGPKGKKLMTKNFKHLLSVGQNKSMKDQKEYLENYLTDWIGTNEQIDDILVIGIRI